MTIEELKKYPPFILLLTTKSGKKFAIDPLKRESIIKAFNDSTNSIIRLSDYEVGVDRFDFFALEKRKVSREEVEVLKDLIRRKNNIAKNDHSSLPFNEFIKSQSLPYSIGQ